jgi:cytosine/adenosine deaminase-related metal-dependent hydrolase
LLVYDAEAIVTMDAERRELRSASVLVVDEVISAVGERSALERSIALDPTLRDVRRIDARGTVVLPGLVNGHHHLFQTLTRSIGTARGLRLFDWLRLLYPIWGRLTPEAARVSATIGLAELMLSGATTVADHLYLYPNGVRLEDTIEAALTLGVRFHPTRGSMSLGESQGGLPPDSLVEQEANILADCRRLLETWHDPSPLSMLRIGIAPCSPFSVTPELMRQSARLARAGGLVCAHGAPAARGHRQVGTHAERRVPLPEQQHDPRVGHRARAGHARRGREGRPRCRRLRQQRRQSPARRGASGDALAARGVAGLRVAR